MKKLILLDIDNTVFDSGAYRITLFEKLHGAITASVDAEEFAETCQTLADEMVQATGMFDTQKFVDMLCEKYQVPVKKKMEVLTHLFRPEYASLHVFPETLEVLDRLSKIGEIGILSQGEDRFQRNKLTSFLHYLTTEHIHIHLDKRSQIKKIMSKYLEYRVYYVDDILVMLAAAKSADPQVFTIWSKRGKYALAKPELAGFTPDAVIENLNQLEEIIANN